MSEVVVNWPSKFKCRSDATTAVTRLSIKACEPDVRLVGCEQPEERLALITGYPEHASRCGEAGSEPDVLLLPEDCKPFWG